MTVFFVELDNWMNVKKIFKSSAEQVAALVDSVHNIELPPPKATHTGWRVWLEAEDEAEAKREARFVVRK